MAPLHGICGPSVLATIDRLREVLAWFPAATLAASCTSW